MDNTEIHFCCRICYEHSLIYSTVAYYVCASNEWVLLWIKLCKMLATIIIIMTMMMMIITKSLSILLLCVHTLAVECLWVCAIVHGLKWSECWWRTLHTAFHPPHFLTNNLTHTQQLAHVLYGMAPHMWGCVCEFGFGCWCFTPRNSIAR